MSHHEVLVHEEVKFDRYAASRAHFNAHNVLEHLDVQVFRARGGIADAPGDDRITADLFSSNFVRQNNCSLGGVGRHYCY